MVITATTSASSTGSVATAIVVSVRACIHPKTYRLSAHKLPLFGVAGALLLVNGVWQWRSRRDPCPLDAQARQSCLRTRRAAWRLYLLSLLIFLIGGGFAFLPTLLG